MGMEASMGARERLRAHLVDHALLLGQDRVITRAVVLRVQRAVALRRLALPVGGLLLRLLVYSFLHALRTRRQPTDAFGPREGARRR